MGETIRDGEFRLVLEDGTYQPYLQIGAHNVDGKAAGTVKFTLDSGEKTFVIGDEQANVNNPSLSISDTDQPKHPKGTPSMFWVDTKLTLGADGSIGGRVDLLESADGLDDGDIGWFRIKYIPSNDTSPVELKILDPDNGATAVSLKVDPTQLADSYVILAIYNFTRTDVGVSMNAQVKKEQNIQVAKEQDTQVTKEQEANKPADFQVSGVPEPRRCYIYVTAANKNADNDDPNITKRTSTINFSKAITELKINMAEVFGLMVEDPDKLTELLAKPYSLYYGSNRVKNVDNEEPLETSLLDLGEESPNPHFQLLSLGDGTNKFELTGSAAAQELGDSEFPAGMYVFGLSSAPVTAT